VAGLYYQSRVYPTQELLESALPNDAINLVLAVPMLLASMWLTRRNKLVGLLFWPGALLYVVYNSLPRVLDLPVGWMFAANLALLALGVYTLIVLVARIDSASAQEELAGAVRARLSAVVLIGLGVLFILRAAGLIGGSLFDGTALPATALSATVLSVLVTDILLSPVWVIGGVLLWQRRALGYAGGVGLLFQASALFVGVIAFVLVQPLLTDAPFDLEAVIVLAVMALPCWIPFALFLRGIVKSAE
jgi:hypothetical protein